MSIIRKTLEIEKEAVDFGFRWTESAQITKQIINECKEVEAVIKNNEGKERLEDEIGDIIHAVISLCFFHKLDPEKALEVSLNKFEKRFREVQKQAKDLGYKTLEGESFETLMKFWDNAKETVG